MCGLCLSGINHLATMILILNPPWVYATDVFFIFVYTIATLCHFISFFLVFCSCRCLCPIPFPGGFIATANLLVSQGVRGQGEASEGPSLYPISGR